MARIDNLIPAKKGDVRNPKGRPIGSRNRSTIVKYWLEMTKKGKNPITEMAEVLEIQDHLTLALIGKELIISTKRNNALLISISKLYPVSVATISGVWPMVVMGYCILVMRAKD